MTSEERGQSRSKRHRANPISRSLRLGGFDALAFARCSDLPY
jgi:hypothetical protein